jgi:histidinol-phosphate phosphatase family protein
MIAPLDLSPFALVIFDADNTLRRTLIAGQPCPREPHQWELMPRVREVLGAYDWTARRFGVASNQDQVGYALLAETMARRLLYDMVHSAIGAAADGAVIRLCPHTEADGCACRKPRPGMLYDICRATSVAPSRALFVGDADVDAECAAHAGIHFMWADAFFGR